MKKTVRIIAIVMTLACLCCLCSCGKSLEGTYEAKKADKLFPLDISGKYVFGEEPKMSYTMEFNDGNLTATINMFGQESVEEYTYEITAEDGEYYITLTEKDEDIKGEPELIVYDEENGLTIDNLSAKAEEDTVNQKLVPVKFKFDGKKVKMTLESRMLGVVIESETYTGEYKIKGDEITFEFDDKGAKAWNDTFDFEEDDDTVTIDGITYEK